MESESMLKLCSKSAWSCPEVLKSTGNVESFCEFLTDFAVLNSKQYTHAKKWADEWGLSYILTWLLSVQAMRNEQLIVSVVCLCFYLFIVNIS